MLAIVKNALDRTAREEDINHVFASIIWFCIRYFYFFSLFVLLFVSLLSLSLSLSCFSPFPLSFFPAISLFVLLVSSYFFCCISHCTDDEFLSFIMMHFD